MRTVCVYVCVVTLSCLLQVDVTALRRREVVRKGSKVKFQFRHFTVEGREKHLVSAQMFQILINPLLCLVLLQPNDAICDSHLHETSRSESEGASWT